MIIFLLLFWIILSGQASAFFAISAILAIAITIFFDKKLFSISPFILRINWRFFIFLWKLLKEMFISSIMVMKIIWLNPKGARPVYAFVDAQSKDPITQVMQVNCITLTPGTMSMDLSNNKILVHAISDKAMQELFVVSEVNK